MKLAPLVLAALVAQSNGTFMQVATPCQARIELAQHDQLLTVTGYCRSTALAPARYRYQLRMLHRSHASHSQSNQGGEFTLLPGQDLRLSEVRVSVLEYYKYRAQLVVFDLQGHEVARDSAGQVYAAH